jgi:hypothetical protein
MKWFLKALPSLAVCLMLNQLAADAQQFTTTSPTNHQLRFDNNGNLLLRGFVLDNIPEVDLQNASWNLYPPYYCPLSLWFGSPLFADPVSTPYRAWEMEGNLFLQGDLFTNQGSLPAGGVAFKNSSGQKVAVLTPEADLYMLGNVVRDASCTTPVYNPSKWNDDPDITDNNNCYNYANDKITMTYAQPGLGSHQDRVNSGPDALILNAQADGLEFKGLTNPGSCQSGHLVVCFIKSRTGDYHWLRKDSDGTWSHKMNGEIARNVDNNGNIITDPENCAVGYDLKVGYFCTCGDNVEIR